MNWKTAWITIFALLLIGAGAAGADELTDLKSQVGDLETKIEALEKKQQEQDQQLEKVPEIEESVEEIQDQPSAREVVSDAVGKLPTIGGHFKFYLGDQSTGEVNGEDQHNSFGLGVSNLWIYINKTLTDWLQISVAPEIVVLAEATPRLGSDITRATSADVDIDLDEAYLTARLPMMFELKAGAFYPMFSEEYGTKSWWHEQYHQNNGLATLEGWQSTGIELYRNFDFANFSLPVSLGFLNGEGRGTDQDSRFTDNNSAKSGLLHLAPEMFLFSGRLRVMGSFGYGRWDDEGDKDSYQWAAGAEYTRSSISVSGEYMNRWREALPLLDGGTEDGEDNGWYAKVKYSPTDKWRFVLKYSDVDLWSASTDQLLTDNYQSLAFTVGWWITESSTIMPQIEYVDADRSDTDITLEYFRYTLGWRTTF
ncbi:MAG: hypothetical protein WBY88_13275 [Desulfosarcina sp.]